MPFGVWQWNFIGYHGYNGAAQSIKFLAHAATLSLSSVCRYSLIRCRADRTENFYTEMRHASTCQIRAHINIPTHTYVFAHLYFPLLPLLLFRMKPGCKSITVNYANIFFLNFLPFILFPFNFFSVACLRLLKSGKSFNVSLQSRNKWQQNRMVSQVLAI